MKFLTTYKQRCILWQFKQRFWSLYSSVFVELSHHLQTTMIFMMAVIDTTGFV